MSIFMTLGSVAGALMPHVFQASHKHSGGEQSCRHTDRDKDSPDPYSKEQQCI